MNPRALAALLLAAALAGCAAKPPAPVAPTPAEWDAVAAGDYTCKPGEYVTVEFAAVAASPTPYFEKCVRLRALFDGRALYRDATSRNTPRPDGHEFEDMIGLDTKQPKTAAGFADHPQFVFAAGRLRSCAARRERYIALADRANAIAATHPQDGLVTAIFPAIGGFCHYSRGPALYATRIDVIPTAMD